MLVNAKVVTTIDLKPGDPVEFRGGGVSTIKRLVEDAHGVRVSFDNGTWRPISTHGVTWSKVWEKQ